MRGSASFLVQPRLAQAPWPSTTWGFGRGMAVVTVSGVGLRQRLQLLQLQGHGCGGRAATLGEFPNQPLRATLSNKILLFKPAAPNKHLASHTAQLSKQT